MAKSVEMSVEKYAESIGKTRGTIYRWVHDQENGKKSKLPKGVTFKKKRVASEDYYVIIVKQ